jgi:hypothetical protein
MYYLFESIFVGIYCSILYFLFSFLKIKNIYILLFIIGFFKHYIAYEIGIQNYYCEHGYACKNKKGILIISQEEIIFYSLIEGLLFLILGMLLLNINYLYKNQIILYFIIGVSLHILSEIFGIHKKFCNNLCL